MVTASEGSPSLVTRIPLNQPPAAPTRMHNGMTYSMGQLAFHRAPISELESPTIDPTERSTSPATTSIVMGSATSAMGIVTPTRNPRLDAVPKESTRRDPYSRTSTG